MSDQTVGRYEIKSEVGRGGMSTVFHAYDPRFKRDVAIKVLPREFLHDPLFRTRFEREAETIAHLEHQAIVPVYDFGEDDGQMFLVMRYMGGGSLADRIEKGPMSLSRVVNILERIAPALDKAHGLGVVHRDLKSANILFDEDENAFLSDFGIAKLTETTYGLTGTGSMIGTPAYMSPEQARGDPGVDGRSDLYSMGVILFEMLTGELPFEADTPMGIAIKHITDPVPRVLQFQPDLPPRCEAVILRSMHKNPDERYPSAESMVLDLKSAVSGNVGESATMEGYAPRPPDTKELPSLSLAGGGAVNGIPLWGWIGGGVVLVGLISAVLFGGNLFGAGTGLTPTPSPSPSLSQEPSEIPRPTIVLATLTPRPLGPALGGGGGLIAFISGREGLGNLYTINLSCIDATELCGVGATQLTTDSQNNRHPVFSPDGSKIAYRSSLRGNQDIFLIDSDGSNVKQLTNNPSLDYNPSWSPDGKLILFVSDRDSNSEIYVMDMDGTNQTRLTHNFSNDQYPSFSPDGKKIIFSSRREQNTDIYLMDASCITQPSTCDIGQPRLTNDPGLDYSPAWSPDGSKVAFVSERDGTPNIYVMNPDGTGTVRLTNEATADTDPQWSRDGKYILFVSRRDNVNNTEIYIMNADGTGQRRITNIPAQNLDPSWQP
jgi:Tol biopolymer transport system component/predicted Ser/Thr protein kinase